MVQEFFTLTASLPIIFAKNPCGVSSTRRSSHSFTLNVSLITGFVAPAPSDGRSNPEWKYPVKTAIKVSSKEYAITSVAVVVYDTLWQLALHDRDSVGFLRVAPNSRLFIINFHSIPARIKGTHRDYSFEAVR